MDHGQLYFPDRSLILDSTMLLGLLVESLHSRHRLGSVDPLTPAKDLYHYPLLHCNSPHCTVLDSRMQPSAVRGAIYLGTAIA